MMPGEPGGGSERAGGSVHARRGYEVAAALQTQKSDHGDDGQFYGPVLAGALEGSQEWLLRHYEWHDPAAAIHFSQGAHGDKSYFTDRPPCEFACRHAGLFTLTSQRPTSS